MRRAPQSAAKKEQASLRRVGKSASSLPNIRPSASSPSIGSGSTCRTGSACISCAINSASNISFQPNAATAPARHARPPAKMRPSCTNATRTRKRSCSSRAVASAARPAPKRAQPGNSSSTKLQNTNRKSPPVASLNASIAASARNSNLAASAAHPLGKRPSTPIAPSLKNQTDSLYGTRRHRSSRLRKSIPRRGLFLYQSCPRDRPPLRRLPVQ